MTASVVEVLEGQHRAVAELFERVSSPDEDRPAVLNTLLKELAAHVAAERSAVAPVTRQQDLGEDLPQHLKEDYQRIDALMVDIERRKFNSPDIPELVSQLKAAVEEHSARSERELFPGLTAQLSSAEQAELGDKVQSEENMVLSHPHPHLLSLGPIADKLTAVASRWDRLRDRTVNNRHPNRPGETDRGSAEGAAKET